MSYCCEDLENHLQVGEVSIHEFPQGPIGIDYRPGTGGGYQLIAYCPWCGQMLPPHELIENEDG